MKIFPPLFFMFLACFGLVCTNYSPAKASSPYSDANYLKVNYGRAAPDSLPESTVLAQELRLQIRELGDQLFTTRSNADLKGLIGLPASFVNVNNFTETSPLGRYLSESLFYELGQRGVPVREYRLKPAPQSHGLSAEFPLSRSLPPLQSKESWGAVLVGTYLHDESGIFINARMVRTNGDVVRTAQLFLPMNDLLERLLVPVRQNPFRAGSIPIVQ